MKAIRTILACIRKADQTYNLINHGDKIVVGFSGGKDSVVLLYALSLYQKFSHTDFKVQPVFLDLGFSNVDTTPLKEFVKSLGFELYVEDSKDVFKILKANTKDAHHLPCSICSKMKKAAINKVANNIKYNKVAFAHHADDAIETFIMNQIYGGRLATFAPKMHLERADITFIRPLILVREKDILKVIKEENLPVFDSHCPADKETTREEIKNYLKDTYKKWPTAYENYLRMLENYVHEDTWSKEVALQVNQCGLNIKPVTTPEDRFYVDRIRNLVFIQEQKITYELEYIFDEEFLARHYLICLNEKPIGTIRYIKDDKGIHIQRFALLKEYRHKGYGEQVFKFFVSYLGKIFTPTIIYIHAQFHLLSFYEKTGLQAIGEPFLEAGKKHILMQTKV